MRFLLFIPALLFLASCQTGVHKQSIPSPIFDIRLHQVDLPNTIIEIVPHSKGYLCLLNNEKLVLLDSNFKYQLEIASGIKQQYHHPFSIFFKSDLICQDTSGKFLVFDKNLGRKKETENMLNKTRAKAIASVRDTIWLGNEDELYYLVSPYNIKKADRKKVLARNMILFQADKIFSDSVYTILGCGAGEFGGSVFFFHNKTGEVHYYPAYAPVQALKYDNGYVVINSLAHLAGSTYYLRFASPEKLFLTQSITDSSFCCNCDKLYTGKERGWGYQQDSLFGVTYYYALRGGLTFLTFPYQAALYSIQIRDSLYYVVKHASDTVLVMDSFRSQISYPGSASINHISNYGALYAATGSGYGVTGSNESSVRTQTFTSVAILANGTRIDILEIEKTAVTPGELSMHN